MQRLAQESLKIWYHRQTRKPLVLRGARQVGKSTLVRQFAKEQQIKLAEINLERHVKLDTVFKTLDTKKILRELEVVAEGPILPGHTLLFLDEIQSTPEALPALRYLYEDCPNLAVISAGSLLEFVLAEHQFSMPVGRIEYFHLGPMCFTEFLLALNEHYLVDLLRHYKLTQDFPEFAQQKLLDWQRLYLFIGGMPESIAVYVKTQSLSAVQDVHRSILQTYQDDFAKYTKNGKQRLLLTQVIAALPKSIACKVKYSNIARDSRSAEVKAALDLLVQSRLLHIAYHTDGSGVPFSASQDRHIFKLYFLDCGLLNTLCGWNWQQVNSLTERELINEGVLAEQFIAQHLAYIQQGKESPCLHYWLRESKTNNAEIDFLMVHGTAVIPIEVKSGKTGTLKSLQFFMYKKQLRMAVRFDLNKPALFEVNYQLTASIDSNASVRFKLMTLPLYMVEYMLGYMQDMPME